MTPKQILSLLILVALPITAWYFQPGEGVQLTAKQKPIDSVSLNKPFESRAVFMELMDAQLAAGVEIYSNVGHQLGAQNAQTFDDRMQILFKTEEKMIRAKEAEIAAKYSLNREQIEAIIAEGVQKGWLNVNEAVVLDK